MRTIASFVALGAVVAAAWPAPARADILPEIAVAVDGRTVRVGGPTCKGEVPLWIEGVTSTAVVLPLPSAPEKFAGPDFEAFAGIVATAWHGAGFPGVALAVETVAPSGERSWWWATVALEGDLLRPVACSRFLQGETDFDLVGIVNSMGDSIYVVLARHIRPPEGPDGVSGYVFVHDCPIGAVPGALYELSAKR